MKQPELSGRLAWWVFKLQPYKFTISHIKGRDALSRIHAADILSVEIMKPEVDLNSDYFNDKDYKDLKKCI